MSRQHKIPVNPLNPGLNVKQPSMIDNLMWQVDDKGRKVSMTDIGGFSFDLDKKGCIVQMRTPNGDIFKWK